MDSDKKITWFHLPDAPEYDPNTLTVSERYGGSILGEWLSLPVGTKVTLHGVNGEWNVIRSHFHVGHPDEQGGMHIFLEPA